MSIRRRTWELVEPARDGDRLSHAVDLVIISLILINVLAVVLETMPGLGPWWGPVFRWLEVISVALFSLEYAARLWSCVEDPRWQRPLRGRLRFSGRFLPMIDLLSILPFYLPLLGVDLRFMRILRTLRILRALKFGRYSKSLHLIGRVVKSRQEELVMSAAVMALLVVLSSCIMYHCEHEAQHEAFSSIPAAMWWSVATLTTVGYGDIYPVTVLGKLVAGIITVLGIGMVALPAGILGSGFVEEMRRKKVEEEESTGVCPHCGQRLEK